MDHLQPLEASSSSLIYAVNAAADLPSPPSLASHVAA
jgi:hypothetical protein